MIFRGRLTESETRARILLDSGARPWRVVCDPSNMFLHGTFRVSDLSAGGFDKGTTFVHIRTGEKCIVDANGTARMVFPGRNKKRGKKLVFVKPVKRVIGSGGANATL